MPISPFTSQATGAENTASHSFLHHGNADDFVAALKREITQHPALSHPYLIALSDGSFPNQMFALKDYAFQYAIYSEWFVRYLEGVFATLTEPTHRELIEHNLEEEKGTPDSPNVEDLPHVEIYRLFKEAVGADQGYCDSAQPSTTVLLWRDLFLQKCSSNIAGVGVAAIGLATECIISTIYPYILRAICEHTELGENASLFFRLHIECDDGHGEAFERITAEIAEDTETREAIRFGVFSSLNLRNAFWDSQYARALHFERP